MWFGIKTAIIFSIYYFLSRVYDSTVIIILVSATIVIYLLYIIIVRSKNNQKLEIHCDAPEYLSLLNRRYKKKTKNESYVLFAYGHVYNGDYKKAEESIKECDFSQLKEENQLIWYNIKLKIAYHNNDEALYRNYFEQLTSLFENNKYEVEIDIAKAPIYLFEKNYDALIEMMMELIPVQAKRFRIVELEYYLVLAYYYNGSLEDAIAISEFMIKKNYQMVYTSMFKELLTKMKD